MIEINKSTVTERIKNLIGREPEISREMYEQSVYRQIEQNYGVIPSEVFDALLTKRDSMWVAYEDYKPATDFVTHIANHLGLETLSEDRAETSGFVSGENGAKIALAQFCLVEPDWDYFEGVALLKHGESHAVIMPSYDASADGWKFSAHKLLVSAQDFQKMDSTARMTVISEAVLVNDISACVDAVTPAPENLLSFKV